MPAVLAPLVSRLDELITLPAGWNSYGSSPISLQAALAAIRLLREVHWAGPLPTVSPTSSGGVVLEWGDDDAGVELEFSPDGSVSVLVDEGSGRPWEAVVTSVVDPTLTQALAWADKLG